jgi:hypothetical protein
VRIANLSGRLALVTDAGAIDVESASAGRFSSDAQRVYERWFEFVEWAEKTPAGSGVRNRRQLPRSRGRRRVEAPEWPMVFTKFVSSFTDPVGEIELPSDAVDWEVELVFVIARFARNVPMERGWDFVAGLTVGQDLSEGEVQLRGEIPQMNIGKSLPGFSAMGPYLVTPDSLPEPDVLEISCSVDGERCSRAAPPIWCSRCPRWSPSSPRWCRCYPAMWCSPALQPGSAWRAGLRVSCSPASSSSAGLRVSARCATRFAGRRAHAAAATRSRSND